MDNVQLKYPKKCAVWSLSSGSFSIMMQQKPKFQVFKKSNMAAEGVDNY